jgi:hypothetical protein
VSKVSQKVEAIVPDFYRWPHSWKGTAEDLPFGEKLVAGFELFLIALIDSGLAEQTIRRHADNLWILGGEIVRDVSMETGENRMLSWELTDFVGPEGGITSRHLHRESQVRSYDSTCRKLWKYLQKSEQSGQTDNPT